MQTKFFTVHRDEGHIFVFAPRALFTGHHAARTTARLLALLAQFDGYLFLPAHDADVFAWVIEFSSRHAAAQFLHKLVQGHKARRP